VKSVGREVRLHRRGQPTLGPIRARLQGHGPIKNKFRQFRLRNTLTCAALLNNFSLNHVFYHKQGCNAQDDEHKTNNARQDATSGKKRSL